MRKASIDEETGVISIIDVPPKMRKRRRRVKLQQFEDAEDGEPDSVAQDASASGTDGVGETVPKTRKRRVKKVADDPPHVEDALAVDLKPKRTRRVKVASGEGEGLPCYRSPLFSTIHIFSTVVQMSLPHLLDLEVFWLLV